MPQKQWRAFWGKKQKKKENQKEREEEGVPRGKQGMSCSGARPEGKGLAQQHSLIVGKPFLCYSKEPF